MLRIGKYTGKDYTNDYNAWLCPECCYWVKTKEEILSRNDCSKCIKSCPAKEHKLTMSSLKELWDKAVLDTFRFKGAKKY